MFRPSPERFDWLREVVCEIARRYGLLVRLLPTPRGVELWLCRDVETARHVSALAYVEFNSPEWHSDRAFLCGVPMKDIDHGFHERQGASAACDE